MNNEQTKNLCYIEGEKNEFLIHYSRPSNINNKINEEENKKINNEYICDLNKNYNIISIKPTK